jgi:hypothetical protein
VTSKLTVTLLVTLSRDPSMLPLTSAAIASRLLEDLTLLLIIAVLTLQLSLIPTIIATLEILEVVAAN